MRCFVPSLCHFYKKPTLTQTNANVWMEENNSEQVNQNKVLGLNNNLWCSDRTELVYSLIWLFKETIQSDFVVTVPLLQSCPWFLKQIWFRMRRNKNSMTIESKRISASTWICILSLYLQIYVPRRSFKCFMFYHEGCLQKRNGPTCSLFFNLKEFSRTLRIFEDICSCTWLRTSELHWFDFLTEEETGPQTDLVIRCWKALWVISRLEKWCRGSVCPV